VTDAGRVLVLASLVLSGHALAQTPARRFALIAGENEGLRGEETLRYAEDDAQRVRDALVEVGGVAPDDVTLLKGLTAESLRAALRTLKTTLATQGRPRDRLVVYLSGHAGDGTLHLDGTEVPLSELVDFVKQAPVEVGVLIVDACRSGAMTRLKGLSPTNGPPVKVEASGLQGRVLISASGADEYAQESDALKGSTFTHHFVTGLRGAADSSRDGRVTLDEVYAWAWSRTIESTFGSRGGVQRPSFKVDLSGNGQLVLSEPAAASGRLTIAVEPPGRWLLVSAQTNAVMAELDKPVGPLSLALPAGGYRVRLQTDQGVLERVVTVPATGGVTLSGDELERASRTQVALKGAPVSSVTLSVGGGVSSGVVNGLGVHPGGEVRARWHTTVLGPIDELVTSLNVRDGRSSGSGFRQTELELRAGGGHRFFFSRLLVFVGVEFGALLMFQNDLPGLEPRTSLGGTAQAALELRVSIVRSLELYLLGTAGGALVKKSAGGIVPVPRAAVSAGVAFVF
jgi:hypothetical protein